MAGDVLAGVWQYMNQPWSRFQEVVFDVMFIKDDWSYIGYGRIAKFKATHSQSVSLFPSSQSMNIALN